MGWERRMNKKFQHRKRRTSRQFLPRRRQPGRFERSHEQTTNTAETPDREIYAAWKHEREEYTATAKIMDSFEFVVQTLSRANLRALGTRVNAGHHRLKHRKK